VEDIDESISLLLGNRRTVEDIDAKTIIKAMAVRKIFKELYPNTPIRIIAEMVEKKNEKLFKDTKIDEIIPTDELIEKIMVQMVSQNLELLPQLVGIVKVVNTPYIVVTKISPDFLRNHQY